MPTKVSDPKCTSKKTHIGNNYVTLVYNESDEAYNIQTVKVRRRGGTRSERAKSACISATDFVPVSIHVCAFRFRVNSITPVS